METPTVNSLLFADHIYRDIETRKWIISGVFNTVGFRTFPAEYDCIEVFFQITNVSRPVDLHFRLEKADSGDTLVDIGGPIGSPSPLNVIEHKIVLRKITFPSPGKYWIQLVSNEEILSQAPLYVRGVDAPPKPHSGGSDPEVEDD